MGKNFYKYMPLAATTMLLGLASSPALAQANLSDPASNTPSDSSDSTEIIVTAQKRSERLQDVPISITSISSEALKTANAKKLTDISDITPGLTFQPAGTFVQPMIRGVGSSNIAPGLGSNVGIYLDGFLLPNPGASDLQLINATSVQVLKGPQGTLFGRNTTGGAILVTTPDPSTDTSLLAELSYGSYDAKLAQAYMTTGLTDKLAVDVTLRYAKGDGWLHNIVNGDRAGRYENFNVRAGIKYDVTDNFSLLARFSHSVVNDASMSHHAVLCCNADGKPYSLAAYIPGAIIASSPNQVSAERPSPGRTRANVAQLTASLDLSFANITSYTQYRDELVYQGVDLASSSIPVFTLTFPYKDRTFTQELLAASHPGGRLQWVAGLYYFSNIAETVTSASFGGAPFAFLTDQHNHVQTFAAYADVTYEIADNLFLTGGLRVAKDKYGDAYNNIGPFFGGPGRNNFSPIDKDTVTPRAVLRYKPTANSSVYASFSKGYKSGFRNQAAQSDLLIRPEKITAYEAGYKLATRGFSANVSAYYYDYSDLQVSSFRTATAVVTNAATSRIYGVDADLRFNVSKDFELTAGGAYTNAKYKSFPGAPVTIQCQIALQASTCPGGVAGAAAGSFLSGATIDLTDSRMQFAPEFTGNVGMRYTKELSGYELELSGNFSYVTKYFLDVAAQFPNTSHENLKLRAQLLDPSKHFTLAVFADNLTNKRYLLVGQPNSLAVVTNYNTPRTIGASVGVKF